MSANQATSLNPNNKVLSASHPGYLAKQYYIDGIHDNGVKHRQVDLMERVPQATTSALTRTPNLAFRYRPPGVPPKRLDAALQGEFIELSEFLPSLGTSYTTASAELEPYLENNNTIHFRTRKHNRKIINFDTWSEAWAEYEKFMVKSLEPEVHESMSNYRSFIFEANN